MAGAEVAQEADLVEAQAVALEEEERVEAMEVGAMVAALVEVSAAMESEAGT